MARGLALTALAGVIVVLAGKPFAALTLTVTALVGIINTLWLAGLVQSVTQPGLPRLSRRVVWRFVARVTLWGFLFGGLYWQRHRVELWAVALGVGCYLAAVWQAAMTWKENSPQEG
jgi:hypothetical protein